MSKKSIMIMQVATLFLVFAMANGFASNMGAMGTDTQPPATAEEISLFTDMWKKAFAEGSFTQEQTEKLASELTAASKKLSENFTVLRGYLDKKKAAKDGETKSIEKRIDITEAERDLIASEVTLALDEFLTKEQANLIQIAGFHGISMTLAESKHLEGMTGAMGMDGKNKSAWELGKLAEKLNKDCEAVTLSIILKTISGAESAMTTME